jgi:AraC-like DNA-binding protein
MQIPYILNSKFERNILYLEETVEQLQNFVICFWEMQPRFAFKQIIENIMVTDGCIGLVADYDRRRVGFVGMSKTDFHHYLKLPSRIIGARLKPGAFKQLTGFPATAVMDSFLPVDAVLKDFYSEIFLSLPYDDAKEYFKSYFYHLLDNKIANNYTNLFDELFIDPPSTIEELFGLLGYSSRKCERLFNTYYGLTPRKVLSIVRFQKNLSLLLTNKSDTAFISEDVTYYDQLHFIKDYKRQLGITPKELIATYQ